eukprot:GHVS01027276.1.p1 GENE.GHVS01027276.1~~GHVS01027276.1.p1  ORF type:complete len:333 (+),score=47.09 GHVS01027276.1:28-999(+)
MNRHILSIVAIVAILSCLSPLHAHTDGEKAEAASSESTLSSRFSPPSSTSLDLPEVFKNGDPNYKLFDYPDMEEFYFHVPIAPWGQPRLNAHVTSCQQELVADFLYQPTAHRIREHYGCDLRPFWKESSQFQMEMEDKETRRRLMSAYVQGVEGTQAAQGIESVQSVQSMETFQAIQSGKQTQSISHLRAARGEGSRMSDYQRSVRVCQLSEIAQGCVFGDRLVSCVEHKMILEMEAERKGADEEEYDSKAQEIAAREKENEMLEGERDAGVATVEWRDCMRRYMAEEGQCDKRIEDVGLAWMSTEDSYVGSESLSEQTTGEY